MLLEAEAAGVQKYDHQAGTLLGHGCLFFPLPSPPLLPFSLLFSLPHSPPLLSSPPPRSFMMMSLTASLICHVVVVFIDLCTVEIISHMTIS